MPKRNAERKAARELQQTAGLGYQEALNRVRAEGAEAPPAGSTAAPLPEYVRAVLDRGQDAPHLAVAELAPDPYGWHFTVVRVADRSTVLTFDMPGWGDWRPASAGHRLIERGYIISPPAHFDPESIAGWEPLPGGRWATPVHPVADFVGEPAASPPPPREARFTEEEAAIEKAREVWPEAEGFERAPGGWTFRVGGGYAWITDAGHVSADPEGLRSHASRRMRVDAPSAPQPAALTAGKAPRVRTYGPRQFPDGLGLAEWEFERAQRLGLIPPPDVAGRWSEAAFTDASDRMGAIREQIGTMPDVGATRAEEHLSKRFGITVLPGTAAELARRGHLPVRGSYKGYSLYCGLTLERFTDRRKVARASAAGRLYMREDAARALNLRPADFAHLVRAGLLTHVDTVLSSHRPRVVVPLYRQADLDRAVRSRRVDWDAVRATPPGRPSPLAKLPTRAQ